jgi:glycosyltransferase involved in cell wall biosynthesis
MPRPLAELPHPTSLRGRAFWGFCWHVRPALRGLRQAASPAGPILDYAAGASSPPHKRALVSYLAQPFHVPPESLGRASHSNAFQAVAMAQALNRLGYIVDIVDWKDRAFTPAQRYDLLLGMQDNFDRLSSLLPKETLRVYYATGAHWAFQDAAEDARVAALRARRGVHLPLPRRLPANTWIEQADAVIVIGNGFTASTYHAHHPLVLPIDNTIIPMAPPSEGKDLAEARRHFLLFAGTGLLHKGLDLLLEAFAGLPDLHLWVCGPLHTAEERAFIRAYRRELFELPNIHPIGWVNPHSERFRLLTSRCAFTVLASCSEGMAGGVLACMSQGLIPLVTRESGIDTDDIGLLFEQIDVHGVREALRQAANLPLSEIAERVEGTLAVAHSRYAPEAYARSIESVLRQIEERYLHF